MADELQITNNNPFAADGADRAVQSGGAPAQVENERAIAEVKASVSMAMAHPRQPVKAMDRILQECQRPTLAEQAVYAYPRGGQQVTGPSIRLAEALARNWGNLDFGIRELENRDGNSVVYAYAWDMETNVRASKVFNVPHERHTKKGKVALTDPRDIYELMANQGARRLRNAILSIIPGDVIESAVRQCEDTMKHAMGAPGEKIESMLKHFGELGVTKTMIEKRLGHRLTAEATVISELLGLHKIYTSIKDGYSQVTDWFEADSEGTADTGKKSHRDAVKEKAARTSQESNAAEAGDND
ncbi:MAG: hypothetical protein ACLFS5_01915 [Spirochaetaceae bacterium]